LISGGIDPHIDTIRSLTVDFRKPRYSGSR
jgi:hypothetical protein